MNTVIATAGVVAFTPGLKRVLLIKHSEKAGHKTGMYGIPAGRLEEGEDAKHAVIRELQEEAGLLINDRENLIPLGQTYSAVIERKDGQREYALEPFIYILEEGVRLKGSEEGEVHLVDIDEVSSLQLLPNVEKMIADAFTQLQT
jgi:8-oxo-dGTP pyrophosphatase MutT (NUDIX family)